MVMDQALRPEACKLATRLRFNGQSVDVVLEQRKMKQVFKVGCSGSVRDFKACCCTIWSTCEVGVVMATSLLVLLLWLL